ncbi:pyridoxamine 5'-phosphate oxidase family protein [Desulfopila sp. IMCC35006]|uniref:pyridoxamine 5'-phosphate oxidase family protein n=1 Tax=Desulfopila sp. IMCC35006 TaxID=2569542 RepID=UPI0010AD8C72|nr:pyridoxamine 5'-phosphate oxidase family protein [Desulfopila sp. IMCC35006]TKB25349.1 pyridoxamine 5'-phosphate oxidase family protein [Desulfopila sp. IMCC35006]
MLTDKFLDVISHEGVVAIVSCADNEAHVVNTWNSYLHITDDERILLPAWSMRKTEKKVRKNNNVLLTVGSKEVEGKMGPGTGFLVKGTARFIPSGPEWDMMKEKYSFLTRVLEVTVESIQQTV